MDTPKVPPFLTLRQCRRSLSARDWGLPQRAQVLRQHGSDVNSLLRDQLAESPDDRLNDGLARLGLDVGEGGDGELIEPSRMGMPRPPRPKRLNKDAEIGGQVDEDVSALSFGQKGSEGREERS